MNGIGPGFVHGFSRLDITGDFVLVQGTDIYIGNSRVFHKGGMDDHDTGDDLMPFPAQAFENIAGIVGVLGFADNLVAQDNNGVCADDKMTGMVLGDVQGFNACDGDGVFLRSEAGLKNFLG